jgi:hypothetical protein
MAVSVQRVGDYNSADVAAAPSNGNHPVLTGVNAQSNIANTQAQNLMTSGFEQYAAKSGVNINDPNWKNEMSTSQYQQFMSGGMEAGANSANAVMNAPNQFENALGDVALAGSVAAIAAAGGGIAGAALGGAGVAGGAGAATLSGTALTATEGAAGGLLSGAAKGALTGGNIGKDALIGGVMGGLGGAASGLGNNISDATGINPTAANALVKGSIGAVGGEINGGNALTGALTGAGGSLGGAAGGQIGSTVGSQVGGIIGRDINGPAQGNSNMPTTTGGQGMPSYQNYATGGASGVGSILQGLGSIAGPALQMGGASQTGSMLNNAYTSAGVAGNSGNTFGTSGLGGMGSQYANGQLNLNGGSMTGASNMFSQFAGSQGGMANMYGNGGVPSDVTSAYNQFNGQVGQGIGTANTGAASATGVMNQGSAMLGSANANYNSAYSTSLSAAQAALNPQIQQQSNALLNSNFERGMSGTSGGALQTQALQNSFNTANLQAQNQAVTQGQNAFNSTVNAGTGMFNSGASQLGNFNNQGVNMGQTGMTGSMNYSAFSPQLAGMYQTNANSAVTGFGGINTNVLNTNQAGQSAITNQGTQANNAARTMGGIGTANYQSSNGLMGNMGQMLNTPGAMNSLVGGASSLFSGLTGLVGSPGSPTDPTGNLFNSDGTIGGVGSGNLSGGLPNFQIPSTQMGQYGTDGGSGGNYSAYASFGGG